MGTVGQAKSDLWQLMEFSKRFKMEEVWPEELLAKAPQYRGKTMYDVLYRNGTQVTQRNTRPIITKYQPYMTPLFTLFDRF